jgi:DNA polymerase-3 subunit epsilon
MRILIFDTETTGLPPRNTPTNQTDKWPHIVQLSWVIYNDETKVVEEEQDYIISLGTHIPISAESTAIHGITSELSRAKGVSMDVALFDFKHAANRCGKMVAHNIEFDKNMILVELYRARMFNTIFPPVEYCTMKQGTPICKLVKVWVDFIQIPETRGTLLRTFRGRRTRPGGTSQCESGCRIVLEVLRENDGVDLI